MQHLFQLLQTNTQRWICKPMCMLHVRVFVCIGYLQHPISYEPGALTKAYRYMHFIIHTHAHKTYVHIWLLAHVLFQPPPHPTPHTPKHIHLLQIQALLVTGVYACVTKWSAGSKRTVMKNVQNYIPTYPRHAKEGTCDISGFLTEGTLSPTLSLCYYYYWCCICLYPSIIIFHNECLGYY